MDTDFELLDRWREGEARAGELLLERYFDALCGFFESKCERDADDLVQRTMLACVKNKDRFRKDSSFRTFLFAVARNELLHHLRSKHREGERFDFATISVAEIVTTPGTRLANNAERLRVVEALRQLPVEQQTLIELFYWQELDIQAISDVFEIDPGATRVRLHRARKRLREILALPGQDDDEALLAAGR